MRSHPWRGRGQAGDGKLGLVFALLVVAGLIYFLKLAIPPRITNAEFNEFLERQTRSYVVNQMTYDQLIQSIVDEASKEGLPIREDDIRFSDGESRVKVSIKYQVIQPLMGGKQWVRDFEVEADVPKV